MPSVIKMFPLQNLHTSAFHTYIGGATAFGFYLDMICLVYLASILSIFILIDFGKHQIITREVIDKVG